MKALAIAVAALLAGCCNVVERAQKPYLVAPHPYYCTVEAAEALAEPFQDRQGPDGIAGAFIAVTYPLWIVSGVCDVALDTVFLPVDAIAEAVRDN